MQYTASVVGSPTAVVLCGALLFSPPSDPWLWVPSTAAREAAELTHAKRYAEAAEAYAEAYRDTGAAVHLYSQAMSLRRAGSCTEAIGAFEAFIEQDPPGADVEAARTQISECQALLARSAPEAPPQADAASEPPPPVVVTPPPDQDATQRRWTRDPWGGALVATGGVVAVTGGGLLVASATSSAPRDETEQQHRSREASVRNTSIAAFSLIGAGAVLLIGGAVRYALMARRGRAQGLTWRF